MRAYLSTIALVAVASCSGSSGRAGPGNSGGPSPDGGQSPDGSPAPSYDASVAPPPVTCVLPAMPVNVSKPTTVVGTGTAASCTEQALDAAVAMGGVVTFNCGSAPVTVAVTEEVAVTKDTTIDGGNLVTLSGGKATRVLHIKSAWNVATPLLTVQNLSFSDGYTSDVMNTKATTQGGAAIFEDGGSLTVINCTFTNNQCASTGEDVSGGAINGQGIGTLIVEGSIFTGNSGSNGGAIGTQAENVTIVNSTFTGNSATGTGGNPGNGGDGGAMSYDGENNSWTMCGDTFSQNHANAQGGAIFRVAYTGEPTTIDRTTFDGNSVDMTMGNAGGIYLENTTITMTGTVISNNSANYGAGIWIGHAAIAKLTNDTIANNHANMGGGVWFADAVTGTFLNVTIANNAGDGLFGGGTGVTLQNTLVDGDMAGPDEGAINCDQTHSGAGVNMQYPNGDGSGCTSGVTMADPMLGPLKDNGGPTETMAPAAASPAIGKGTGCPATDQRGQPRKSACTLGAYEVE